MLRLGKSLVFGVFALTAAAALANDVQVSITDSGFVPTSVTVRTGDTVTWTNTGSSNYNVTNGVTWDSGPISPEHSYTHIFYDVIVINYSSTLNSNFPGIVIVDPYPPVITSALTVSGTTGQYFAYLITATNCPYVYNATGLPDGLTCDPSCHIYGTPAAPGVSYVTISATNGGGTGYATLVLTVTDPLPPVISSMLNVTTAINVPFSYNITASNSPASFAATGLPAGLSINTAAGLIFGTPTALGAYNVTISATNGGGPGSATLALTVIDPLPPVITSPLTADASVAQLFSYVISTSGTAPVTFSTSALPPGLVLSGDTICGVPTQVGSFTITITTVNIAGTDSITLVLTTSFTSYALKVTRFVQAHNVIMLKGSLPVPPRFSASYQTVSIGLGDIQSVVTLNAKGAGANSTTNMNLKVTRPKSQGQNLPFIIKLSGNIPQTGAAIPITLTINGLQFTATAAIKG